MVYEILLTLAVIYGLGISYLLYLASKRIDFFEKWVEEFIQRLFLADEELRKIDARGSFEADDEVGYFFKALKEIMNRLFEMGVINEEEITKEREFEITESELQEIFSKRRKSKETKK